MTPNDKGLAAALEAYRAAACWSIVPANHADALRAAITAFQAEAWKPIETAPKDGTYVLGYGPHSSRGHYVDAIHFWQDRWTIEWMEGFGAPTHWQPLPPPPKASP